MVAFAGLKGSRNDPEPPGSVLFEDGPVSSNVDLFQTESDGFTDFQIPRFLQGVLKAAFLSGNLSPIFFMVPLDVLRLLYFFENAPGASGSPLRLTGVLESIFLSNRIQHSDIINAKRHPCITYRQISIVNICRNVNMPKV